VDHQPRPGVRAKTRPRDRLIALAQAPPDWALGCADAVGWSRVARPALHAGVAADEPLRLVDQTVATTAPDPKALACYGLLVRRVQREEALWLRGGAGRPVSALTTPFVAWCCARLEALGVPASPWGASSGTTRPGM
jgi:hypothetical protein